MVIFGLWCYTDDAALFEPLHPLVLVPCHRGWMLSPFMQQKNKQLGVLFYCEC